MEKLYHHVYLSMRAVRRTVVTERVRIDYLEARWPVVTAIVLVLCILELLPSRIHLLPFWFIYAVGMVLLLPIVSVRLSNGNVWWLRIERVTTQIFAVILETATIVTLSYLVAAMLNHPDEFTGKELLSSSIGVWITNVLTFSLVSWLMDRGGPEARANGIPVRPDWLFPQAGVPEQTVSRWRPTFIDYLFLSFTTAMAFSPTDTMPLTNRAKILMMLESTVALVTLVIVAARAINILSS
jgi:hypothetical protein